MSASWTESFLEQAMKSEGWGAFDSLQEKVAEINNAQDEQLQNEAALVKAALAGPAGQKFLHWLVAKTLLRSPENHELHAQTAEHYAITKAKREGQNAIVFMILQALNIQPKQSPAQSTGQMNEGHQ